MAALPLHPHPATPCPAVTSFTVAVVRDRDLHLTYELRGNLTQLAIPAPARAGFADELWRHTCFEVFVALSPAPLTASSISRRPDNGRRTGSPRIDNAPTAGGAADGAKMDWQRARIASRSSPSSLDAGAAALRLGASAVIETRTASSLLALTHPPHGPISTPPVVSRSAWTRASRRADADRTRSPARRSRAARAARRPPCGAARPSGLGDRRSHARARRVGGVRRPAPHGRLRSAARHARRQAGQHDRVAGLRRPAPRHPHVQPLWHRAEADRGDDGHLRPAARRPAGRRHAHLHLRDDAAVRPRGSRGARQGGLGARPAQPDRPPDRRPLPAPRLGELRRRRPAADPPRPHARRARPVVHPPRPALARMRGGRHAGMGAGRRTGLGLAARRARLGEPEPERRHPVDGARVSRHGHARRHDAVRGPRHDPSARAVRRARPRRRRAARAHDRDRAGVARRLPAAAVLVRADFPQARRPALHRPADPRR